MSASAPSGERVAGKNNVWEKMLAMTHSESWRAKKVRSLRGVWLSLLAVGFAPIASEYDSKYSSIQRREVDDGSVVFSHPISLLGFSLP